MDLLGTTESGRGGKIGAGLHVVNLCTLIIGTGFVQADTGASFETAGCGIGSHMIAEDLVLG